MAERADGYRVRIEDSVTGWLVAVDDPTGAVVLQRPCRDASEARTLASTVRQHLYWLSPQKFREYYGV
ncbi:MAG: hypothetical protein ACXVPX_05775 [Actinomycetota bacterium]